MAKKINKVNDQKLDYSKYESAPQSIDPTLKEFNGFPEKPEVKEDNAEETPAPVPPAVPDLKSVYDSTPELQNEYDFVDGALVKKKADIDTIVEPLENDAKDLGTWISERETEAKEYAKQSAKQVEQNKKAQIWGGIAEGAAALTNLFGTIGGAAPQKWNSPQPGWQQRVDTIVRERDAKLENYKTQLASLKSQKSAIDQKVAATKASYTNQQARIEASVQNAITRAQASMTSKLATLDENSKKAFTNNVNSTLNAMIRGYVSQNGVMPSQSQIERWTNMAIYGAEQASVSAEAQSGSLLAEFKK